MFKRKDKQDAIHQTNIKRGITSHFARTLKVLQQRHLQTDSEEFIYSDDFSNNLCSALEAVFLHGLKDSVVSKMSNYVGLASNQDQIQYISFWSVCAKFTHSDVITQLRGLAQINTDIGLCRAWIRLALNDGLMESYLHSMIVDRKLLTYYYHSYSYLRDHEQPGILKNFLTGLMSLSFKLSFNSSVLNAWNNTSLQLAGLLESSHIPRPAVSATNLEEASSAEPRSGSYTKQAYDEPIVVNRSNKSNPRSDSAGQVGHVHPMFSSIRDVEEIRRITLAQIAGGAQSVKSEGSTSSHISCPDPGPSISDSNIQTELSKCVLSPALYPRADSDMGVTERGEMDDLLNSDVQSIKSLSNSEIDHVVQSNHSRKSSKSSVIIEDSSPFFELEIAQSLPRPRSRRVDDDDLKTMSPRSISAIALSNPPSTSHSLSDSPKISYIAEGEEKSIFDKMDRHDCDVKSDSTSHDHEKHDGDFDATDSHRMVARGYEEICATLPPIKLDPAEQDLILKKVLGEIDEQADRERERREEQRLNTNYAQTSDNSIVAPLGEFSTNLSNSEIGQRGNERDSGISLGASLSPQQEECQKGERTNGSSYLTLNQQVEAVSSTEVKRAVNIDSQTSVERAMVLPDDIERKDEACEREDITSEGEDTAGSPSYGNSLSGMMGWSSEIDSSPRDRSNKRLREKTRGESFASMLKTYAGEKSLISTTLDQVIQTFYGNEPGDGNNSPPSAAGLSGEDENDMTERQDSCLEDFEILSPPSDSIYGAPNMDSSRSIFLFRIPREHGLSHQNFICRGCSRPIGIIYGQPRLCEFDGGLYCYECHENNESCIPSYIVFNWDFGKRKVSVENFKFLQALEDQALYDLEDLNSKLETHVAELATLKVLRHQLCFLKSYMFNCTQKVAESLRQRVWPREHLYERSSVYSVNDFHQVQSGGLVRFVKDLVKFSSKHVYQCSLCSQKGFVCEVCRNPQVIFPFELDTTTRCTTCKSVYHKTCRRENLPCPKCERWGRRNQTSQQMDGEDHPEDYGLSPGF